MKNKAIVTSRQKQSPGLLLTQTHRKGGQETGSKPSISPAAVPMSKTLCSRRALS